MQWGDLLKTADELAIGVGGNRRPRQSNLRRAVSTAYYAMFHCLADCCATTLVGGKNANVSRQAWRQVYRALEHNFARKNCTNKDFLSKFPQEIENFANTFVSLQEKRHLADYDPVVRFTKIQVQRDIDTAKAAIDRFRSASRKHLNAFAVYVLFRKRQDSELN